MRKGKLNFNSSFAIPEEAGVPKRLCSISYHIYLIFPERN